MLRQAREWTIGSDDHVAALVSLGNALLDRSEIGRPVQDLEESIACLEQALTLVTLGTSRWGHIASNLANALLAVFRATGRQSCCCGPVSCSRTRSRRSPIPGIARSPD